VIVYSLRNLRKQFGATCVLDVETIDIEQGYIYALLGPNGSGKTTLLNIMGFLDNPSQGSVVFKGTPVVYHERSLQQLRKSVVVVNQNPILFTTTVYGNLEFGLKVRGIAKQERRKIVHESLDLVGMRHLELAPAHKLSGGETQRIVLARALALSPDVILCDEPTASVDLENQIKISQILRDINREKGITVVFTSHDKRQAAFLPHHRLFLEQGKISRVSYENIFSLHLLKNDSRFITFINNLPAEYQQEANAHSSPRIQIKPELVRLTRPGTGAPAVGVFTGTVLRISIDGEKVRLIVDCGVRLAARMSMPDYRELRPLAGEVLQIQIPHQALSVLN
jgi:tungstate transport system ATP-binding protein